MSENILIAIITVTGGLISSFIALLAQLILRPKQQPSTPDIIVSPPPPRASPRAVPHFLSRRIIISIIIGIITAIIILPLALHFYSPPPTHSYPPSGWKLSLDDPMLTNSGHFPQTSTPNSSCSFTSEGYQVSIDPVEGQPTSKDCITRYGDFTDFAFEAQVRVVKGNLAGVDLRYDTITGNTYYFWISAEGTYGLEIWHGTQRYKSLGSGSSSAFNTGFNQPNLIAVVIQGNTFYLYANKHLLSPPLVDKESTFNHGYLALDAFALNSSTQVLFTFIKVWTPSEYSS